MVYACHCGPLVSSVGLAISTSCLAPKNSKKLVLLKFHKTWRMKDLLLCVHVVVKTLNLEISRCHLAHMSKKCI